MYERKQKENSSFLISNKFLTSGAEIFSQLGGVLLYGRAEAEIPLLSTQRRKKIDKIQKSVQCGMDK